MGMAVSMAAMMAPTAAPFFLAYGRDTRRPAPIATVVLIYVAVWAVAGLAIDHLMSQATIPLSLPVVAISVAVAVSYTATPWGRWAREQCRQMSTREPRGARFRDAVAEGATYTACCVVCSAGVMLVVIVLGMSNPLVIVAGAAVMLAYKAIPWPDPVTSPELRRR
jgi:predicted metal-binding membrane protein